MLVDMSSHEYPWFWPFNFPAFKIHYDIKMQGVDSTQGKKFSTQVSVLHLQGPSTDLSPQELRLLDRFIYYKVYFVCYSASDCSLHVVSVAIAGKSMPEMLIYGIVLPAG